MGPDKLEKVLERTATIEHSDLKPERSACQEQNREASARRRALRKYGRVCLKILAERKWLDALEERGYLDPFDRGNRADECEAIETFLAESLARPR